MKPTDVKFSSKSMVDDFGRVFFYGNKVYRAIYPDSREYCLNLISSPLFKELSDKGCIPETKIAEIDVDGYAMVLEHEKLLEIQQHEWSFEMFRKAALTVLETNEICNRHGFELKDAHTFNVLFRGTEPVYADIGSIAPLTADSSWRAISEFVSTFCLPLRFYAQNEFYIFRKLVESNFYRMQTAPFQDLWDSGLVSMLGFRHHLKFRNRTLCSTKSRSECLKQLVEYFDRFYHRFFKRPGLLFHYDMADFETTAIKKRIERLPKNRVGSEWAGYHSFNYASKNGTSISPRFSRLIELMERFCSDAASVVDLAGNEGFFSALMSEKLNFDRIILTDYDANAIDIAYENFRKLQTKNISVAVLNFMFTPSVEETAKRFRSGVAIALAVTHHLILTQKYSLDTVFERLKLFSDRYVIVEFMPLGLWSIHTETGTPVPEWYTREWFERKFKRYFTVLHSEKLEENRIVYIGCF